MKISCVVRDESESESNSQTRAGIDHSRRGNLLRRGNNCLLWLIGALMRHIAREYVSQCASVVREDLRVPLAARDRNIGHATVEKVGGSKFGVGVDEHALCGLALTGVAGDGIAVIEMWI